MKKKTGFRKMLLLWAACFLAAALLCGFDENEQRVYDGAELLTAAEEEELQTLLTQQAQEARQDLIVVTVSDNEGKSAQAYADDFYDTHGFGYEQENGSGVLLLLDMDGREIYISTAGTAIEEYTDGEIEDTLDVLVPLMQDGAYMEVCRTFAGEAVRCLTGGDTAQNGAYDAGSDRFTEYDAGGEKTNWLGRAGICLLGAAVISGIIVFFIARGRKSRMTAGSGTYLKNGRIDIRQSSDRFTHTTVVVRQIPKDNGSSGGGHSSSHVSSGGRSHGGGGRSF
ncbi:MAG TPA: TPM domain-containing protein [Firmicutes bacterium]|nr:TPM domain-containing protein [Bacillota bacterium]